MEINASNLEGIFTAFNRAYQQGLREFRPDHSMFTLEVPSTTETEDYGWLAAIPEVREWLGERVYNNLVTKEYRVRNKDFELTIEVPRNKIEDDRFGHLSIGFQQMGQKAAKAPGRLVYSLLKDGETELCFDGQPFFSLVHPMGKVTFANLVAGGEEPWYLMDTSQAIKPMLHQLRRPFEFQAFTSLRDENVFKHKKYVFGVDARYNSGFGLPQLAIKSKQLLNEGTLDAARVLMRSYKNEQGEPLDTTPTLLLVGPNNQLAAEKLLEAINNDAGASNVFASKMALIVSNYLAT